MYDAIIQTNRTIVGTGKKSPVLVAGTIPDISCI